MKSLHHKVTARIAPVLPMMGMTDPVKALRMAGLVVAVLLSLAAGASAEMSIGG